MGKRVYIVSLVAQSIYIQSRIGFKERSQQNLAEFGGLSRIWQNAVNCRQIAVDCRQIAIGLPSCGQQKQVDICKVLQRYPITNRHLPQTISLSKYSQIQVSEVRVRLGVTSGYARPPKVRDISSKYHPPPLGGGPYFLDAFLRPRLVLGQYRGPYYAPLTLSLP